MTPYIYALFTAVLMSVGQMLFKKAAMHIQTLTDANLLSMYILNIWFISAVFLYGISTFLWVLALGEVKVSVLYPITSLSYMIVPLFAFYFFGERITVLNTLGLAMIFIGILMATRQ